MIVIFFSCMTNVLTKNDHMITTIYHCRKCGSQNIISNGHNRSGSQQYVCKDCRASGVLTPKQRYSPERREEILRAYQERPSMRGIRRIFGVSRNTLAAWIKKNSRPCRRCARRSRVSSLRMCWKLMKPGVLCAPEPINNGSGRFCCVVRGISLPL